MKDFGQLTKLGGNMAKKIKYSFWIGLVKTAKNSAVLLIPFVIALMAGLPGEYAWIAGPVIYLLKNYAENK